MKKRMEFSTPGRRLVILTRKRNRLQQLPLAIALEFTNAFLSVRRKNKRKESERQWLPL
jgi:hypothetical protein